MAENRDWNASVITEFRTNGGRVGGVFAGRPLLLLHTIGARTGQARVHPLMYRKVDSGYAVFGSKAGAPSHPAWYHNLVANPEVEIEVGEAKLPVRARVAEAEERHEIWSRQKEEHPFFADYEESAGREIPVVVLEPTG